MNKYLSTLDTYLKICEMFCIKGILYFAISFSMASNLQNKKSKDKLM